jgi:hypothetical protein
MQHKSRVTAASVGLGLGLAARAQTAGRIRLAAQLRESSQTGLGPGLGRHNRVRFLTHRVRSAESPLTSGKLDELAGLGPSRRPLEPQETSIAGRPGRPNPGWRPPPV